MLSVGQMGRMSQLLKEALELDAGGRRRWLEELSADDRDLEPALRRALLAQGDEAAGSEELAALPGVGAAVDPNPVVTGAQAGERVGPYRLIRPLGSGGMAQVWLAQRADGAYQREVALKLPATVLRQDLASRFGRERDILAKLEHPNIARLYDAGISAEGQPYLAMEFVSGQPLTGWCDAQRLGIRERLKLFLQVLDAVQYAHGRQVIHRDLKPSNILVTDSGQVRLLDFGVAKLLAQSDESTQLTQLYGQALTPQYASPEQLRGDEVSAASDVYSLGVLLYELLAGAPPYKVKAAASAALLEQAVASAAVQRPSTRIGKEAAQARAATASQLARGLQGDLDAIALKALSKNPADRYASATALADDLRRYLAGEPVQARPDTPLYRLSKFVGRHRTALAVSAIATAVVLVAAVHEIRHRPVPAVSSVPAALALSSTGGAAAATAAPPIHDFTDEKSIAVLPFVDMSEKHDQEYFSDGLSEEVLDLLSRVPALHVAARTSAFSFKGKADDIPTIARKLLVANVLEGSVRKDGNRLRITAQLVRADNGYHLWSQTYDRKLDDIFRVQDEIAEAVVDALKLSLLAHSLPKTTGTANTEAYNLFLQGRAIHLRAKSVKDYEKAALYLQRALKLDPDFAQCWAWLSVVHAVLAEIGGAPIHASYEQARREVIQALKLNPNLSEGHSVMAYIHLWYDWDWPGTETEVRTALELDPNNVWAWWVRGVLAQLQRHDDVALQSFQEAVAIDPLNTLAYGYLGYFQHSMGHNAEAQRAFQERNDLDPGRGAFGLGLVKLAGGDPAGALAEFEHSTWEESRVFGRAVAYHAMGRESEAYAALTELEKKYAEQNGYDIADVYAFRGDHAKVFLWLDRAYVERDSGLMGLTSDPFLKDFRSDARFKQLLVKMKLDVPQPAPAST